MDKKIVYLESVKTKKRLNIALLWRMLTVILLLPVFPNMIKYIAGASTAAGDTVKTSLGTITLPANSKQLLGAWGYAIGGPGLTTLENVSGIIELESPDINIQPCQFPIEQAGMLTGGGVSLQNKVWPMNARVAGGERITGYVTMDMAQTVANTARFGLVVEVA
jgi:hypothetical protein